MARFLPVVSGAMVALAYEQGIGRLVVQFGEDSYYEYDDVPGEVVLAFLFAESHGQAFDLLVKKGGYSYRPIPTDQARA